MAVSSFPFRTPFSWVPLNGSLLQSTTKVCDGVCLLSLKLFPCLLYPLLEVSHSQKPSPWSWGWEEAETQVERRIPSELVHRYPHLPLHLLALISSEDHSGHSGHLPLENPTLAQSMRTFVSAFHLLLNSSAFSSMWLGVVAVSLFFMKFDFSPLFLQEIASTLRAFS